MRRGPEAGAGGWGGRPEFRPWASVSTGILGRRATLRALDCLCISGNGVRLLCSCPGAEAPVGAKSCSRPRGLSLRTGARRRGRPVSGWVAVTQKPRCRGFRRSYASCWEEHAHTPGGRTELLQEVHASPGRAAGRASGRDLPDACTVSTGGFGRNQWNYRGASREAPRPGALPACLLAPRTLLGLPFAAVPAPHALPRPGQLWPLVLRTSGLQTRATRRGPAQNVRAGLPGPGRGSDWTGFRVLLAAGL